jgi:hypothetical protein
LQHFFASFFGRALSLYAGSSLNAQGALQARKIDCHQQSAVKTDKAEN